MYNFVFAQQALKPNKPALKHIKKKKKHSQAGGLNSAKQKCYAHFTPK